MKTGLKRQLRVTRISRHHCIWFSWRSEGSYFLECMALLRFHNFSVPSSEAVSSTAWLGWNVSARMASKWLRSVKRGFHVFLNSSLLSCICNTHTRSYIIKTGSSSLILWGWTASGVRKGANVLITSMERSLSLATVRSASSPKFMSPPPTASMMKTSEEKPKAPPAGLERARQSRQCRSFRNRTAKYGKWFLSIPGSCYSPSSWHTGRIYFWMEKKLYPTASYLGFKTTSMHVEDREAELAFFFFLIIWGQVLPSPERVCPDKEGGGAGFAGKSDIMPCNLFLRFSEPGDRKDTQHIQSCGEMEDDFEGQT